MVRRATARLRARLLPLMLVAIIPALVFAVHLHTAILHVTRLHEMDEARLLVQCVTLDQAGLLKGARHLLLALAELHQLRGGDWAACQELLPDLLSRYPLYSNIGVADRHGDIVCTA